MALLSRTAGTAACPVEGVEELHNQAPADETSTLVLSQTFLELKGQGVTSAVPASKMGSTDPPVPRRKQRHLIR